MGKFIYGICEKNKDFIVSEYRSGVVPSKIADKLGCGSTAIHHFLKKHSIEPFTREDRVGLEIDLDYFEVIDSPDKAYWLGFIVADGCIVFEKYQYILSVGGGNQRGNSRKG